MVWQDYVFTFATILFGYALIPQIYHGFKHKKKTITLQTSIITVFGLLAVAVTFYTLDLIISSIVNIFIAILWFILFIQGIIYGK